jgi:sugar lactone lactonase YvrE
VYFTEASTKYRMKEYMLDAVEARPNGRVLKYDPTTSSTSVLVKEANFANGVALSKNEDFFLFCETSR